MDFTCIRVSSTEKVPAIACAGGINTLVQPHVYLRQNFLLLEKALLAGRVSVYFNPHMEGGAWTIGQYQCIDAPVVAATLLGEAEKYIRSCGGKKIIGPMNGSTWDEYRFPLDHHNTCFFTEPVYPSWYTDQFVQNGYRIRSLYCSAMDRTMKNGIDASVKARQRMLKLGIRFRNIDLEHYERELDRLFPFLSSAFEKNELYSPIAYKDFMNKYSVIKPLIDPVYVWIAEDRSGRVAGLCFCLPDHLNREEKGLVIKTIARRNEPALRGLGHALAELVYEQAHMSGIRYIVHAFMHQQGFSVASSADYSGKPFKQYALYEKTL